VRGVMPGPKFIVLTWLLMLGLLGLIAMSPFLHLGHGLPWLQFPAAFLILLMLGFSWMNLTRSSGEVRIAAFVGVFFLFILVVITFTDLLTRQMRLAPFHPPPQVPAPGRPGP
jgi:hypothetical protein